MSPKRRSAKRRSSALGLELVAVRSEIVVSKWCSPYYQTLSRGSFAKGDYGAFDERRGRMQASPCPSTPGGCHVPTALPLRPLRRRVDHPRTAALFDRKARPSAEVAAETRRERRLLPAQERMFVADATLRVPAVADGLLPLPQVEDRRPAAPSPRPPS